MRPDPLPLSSPREHRASALFVQSLPRLLPHFRLPSSSPLLFLLLLYPSLTLSANLFSRQALRTHRLRPSPGIRRLRRQDPQGSAQPSRRRPRRDTEPVGGREGSAARRGGEFLRFALARTPVPLDPSRTLSRGSFPSCPPLSTFIHSFISSLTHASLHLAPPLAFFLLISPTHFTRTHFPPLPNGRHDTPLFLACPTQTGERKTGSID